MSSEWFECVCQFFRAQSENLAGVLNGLGNQNTISDIGGGDQLALPNNNHPFAAATPMHMFMFLLLAIWTWMFLFSQSAKKANEKPANPNPGPERDGDRNNQGPGEVN